MKSKLMLMTAIMALGGFSAGTANAINPNGYQIHTDVQGKYVKTLYQHGTVWNARYQLENGDIANLSSYDTYINYDKPPEIYYFSYVIIPPSMRPSPGLADLRGAMDIPSGP